MPSAGFFPYELTVPDHLDIYIAEVSHTHNVVPEGLFIAIVSTVVETDDPEAELKPGLALLGPIFEKCASFCFLHLSTDADQVLPVRFVAVEPIYSPASSGSYDNVFVTRSYDSTSHFESVHLLSCSYPASPC